MSNGNGLELFKDGSGGNVQSYDRGGTNTLQPLILAGSIINLSGNVGIGTANPIQKFVVSNGGAEGFETYLDGNGKVGLQSFNRQTSQYAAMEIDASSFFFNKGNVGIGTANTGLHKLAVEGTIGARRVKVQQGTWADFVFQPDYELPSLQYVEAYIRENRHLPDVPSEKEVKEEGLDLGEMNRKLLQKVEELTLYIINMEKKNDGLNNRVKILEESLKKE